MTTIPDPLAYFFLIILGASFGSFFECCDLSSAGKNEFDQTCIPLRLL